MMVLCGFLYGKEFVWVDLIFICFESFYKLVSFDWDELNILCFVYVIMYLKVIEVLLVFVIIYKKYKFLLVGGERYGFIVGFRFCFYVCIIVLWCGDNGVVNFGSMWFGIVCYFMVYSVEIKGK